MTLLTQSRQKGFTLIEVLIALVIVAVALSALSNTIGQYVFNQTGLKERVVATWVAQNRLVELQSGLLDSVDKNQKVEMMGVVWQTELKTSPTLVPGVVRADLSVRLEGNLRPILTLSSVMEGQ